jgi:hypothetical protein
MEVFLFANHNSIDSGIEFDGKFPYTGLRVLPFDRLAGKACQEIDYQSSGAPSLIILDWLHSTKAVLLDMQVEGAVCLCI